MAFELKNAPIEPLAEGDLRVVVKPGPDPQNPAEGGQMVFTKEPPAQDGLPLTLQWDSDPLVNMYWYPKGGTGNKLGKLDANQYSGSNNIDARFETVEGMIVPSDAVRFSGVGYLNTFTVGNGDLFISDLMVITLTSLPLPTDFFNVMRATGPGQLGVSANAQYGLQSAARDSNNSPRPYTGQVLNHDLQVGLNYVYVELQVPADGSDNTIRLYVNGVKKADVTESSVGLRSGVNTSMMIQPQPNMNCAAFIRQCRSLTPVEQLELYNKIREDNGLPRIQG